MKKIKMEHYACSRLFLDLEEGQYDQFVQSGVLNLGQRLPRPGHCSIDFRSLRTGAQCLVGPEDFHVMSNCEENGDFTRHSFVECLGTMRFAEYRKGDDGSHSLHLQGSQSVYEYLIGKHFPDKLEAFDGLAYDCVGAEPTFEEPYDWGAWYGEPGLKEHAGLFRLCGCGMANCSSSFAWIKDYRLLLFMECSSGGVKELWIAA